MSDLSQLGALAPALLLVAAMLALPVTSLALRRYRKSVAALMGHTGEDGAAEKAAPTDIAAGGGPRRWDADTAARALRRRRLVHLVITVGAGLFVGMSYTWLFYFWTGTEVLPLRSVFLVIMFTWPAVPGVWVATDGDRRITAIATVVYFIAAIAVSVAGGGGAFNALVAWLLFNGVPTLVVAAFFTRTFRAIGVLVLGVMLLAITGSQALLGSLESDSTARLATDLAFSAGIRDALAVFVAVAAIGFVVAVAAGWWALRRLGGWYTRHGFSDHMLLLGSMCFVFCLSYVASAASGALGALLIGLGIFGVLAVGTLATYHAFVRRSERPLRLLLLRVFDEGGERAGLLNSIGARWRHLGPVRLIGAPDLAAATIEPDEFLAFTSGRLRRLFIDTRASLAQRTAELDSLADPDGRYRVEDFFCFDNTWKATVESLLAGSDLVLMDLRGFSAERLGVTHELELLGHQRAFDRTLLIIDQHTDTDLLDRIVSGTGTSAPHRYRAGADEPAESIVQTLLTIGASSGNGR
jgi:hypothetical protein